jgi:hypothetical protein
MDKIKIIILLTILLVFASCSTNSDSSTNDITPINSLKRITETKTSNGQTSTFAANFYYENGILKSISNATDRIEFFYTGSKITSTIIYNNNVISNSFAITYNNNDLIETSTNTRNNFERHLYTYNNGVLVKDENQSLIGTSWQTVMTNSYEFLNGNIKTKYKQFQNNSPSKYTYEHDNKLNPMHYMIPVLRHIIGLETCNFLITNNETNQYSYTDSAPSTPILDYYYQITYNAQNLPTSIKKYGANFESEATFEYN